MLLDYNLAKWKPLFPNDKKFKEFFPEGTIKTCQQLINVNELQYSKPQQDIEHLTSRVQKYIVEMF